MTWAIEQTLVSDPTARHVLICLANYAGKTGQAAFPSASTLAKETGLSVRTVRYKLDSLVELGVIGLGNQAIAAAYIDRHDRRPTVYDLAMERDAAGAPREERGANEDATGCSSEQNGVQMETERGAPAAANPSLNRPLPVNKPKEGAGKPAGGDLKAKSAKFDPMTSKPQNVSVEAWEGFVQMRKSKSKPLTARACQLIAKKLEGRADADSIVDRSTANSWSDVYPDSAGAGTTGKPSAYTGLPKHTPDMYQDQEAGNGAPF